MSDQRLAELIVETVAMLVPPPERPQEGWQRPMLDELFRSLEEAPHPLVAAAIERRIWSIWCTHDDPSAQAAMNTAIRAIGHDDEEAQGRLNQLVSDWPSWAETWNKRATWLFLRGQDRDSVTDIQRTLGLEPRHFGALCGFAQIALRADDEHSALVALERALVVHPHLAGVRDKVDGLRARVSRVLH